MDESGSRPVSDSGDPGIRPSPGRWAWELGCVLVLVLVHASVLTYRYLFELGVQSHPTNVGFVVGMGFGLFLPLFGLFRRWVWAWWWLVCLFGTLPPIMIAEAHVGNSVPEVVPWIFSHSVWSLIIVGLLIRCRWRGAFLKTPR